MRSTETTFSSRAVEKIVTPFVARLAMRMLTGYGATFLIIQIYTLFFAHLAEELGVLLSLLIAGGGALALTFWLEQRRRESAT